MNYSLDYIKIDKDSPQKFLQSRFLLYCAICLLLLKVFTIAIYINFPSNIFFADITKSALVSFINQARQSSGLQPLVESQKLDQAAQLKAEDMVQKQYFSHTSPQGVSPWYWLKTIGYNYKYAGENLAVGFFDSKEVYNAWVNSPSHKANLLNSNYKEVGTAVLDGFGSNNTVVVVQFFASQQPVKAPSSPVGQQNAVLSQSIEPPVIEEQLGNFTLYNYGFVLQDIIFGFLLLVTGALVFAVLFDSAVINKKQFVFRALLIVVLLSFGALLNKDAIILSIPHQIII